MSSLADALRDRTVLTVAAGVVSLRDAVTLTAAMTGAGLDGAPALLAALQHAARTDLAFPPAHSLVVNGQATYSAGAVEAWLKPLVEAALLSEHRAAPQSPARPGGSGQGRFGFGSTATHPAARPHL